MQFDIGSASPRRWVLVVAGALLLLVAMASLGYWLGQRQPLTVTGIALPAMAPATPPSSPAWGSGLPAPAPPVSISVSDSGIQWPVWEPELEAGIPSRETALTPPPWRLLGAALVDGRWQLIVLRQGAQDAEYYKKGDRLPGGYVIRDINQEDVTLGLGRREIILSYIGY